MPHALIEVWEADQDGLYDVQYSDGRVAARGHLYSRRGGALPVWAITPTPYPIPHDGPVGQLLAATGRSPMRASHLHFMVKADGFRTLVTHIFVPGDEFLDRDSVFGVKDSLVKDFTPSRPAPPPPTAGTLVTALGHGCASTSSWRLPSPGNWNEWLSWAPCALPEPETRWACRTYLAA